MSLIFETISTNEVIYNFENRLLTSARVSMWWCLGLGVTSVAARLPGAVMELNKSIASGNAASDQENGKGIPMHNSLFN